MATESVAIMATESVVEQTRLQFPCQQPHGQRAVKEFLFLECTTEGEFPQHALRMAAWVQVATIQVDFDWVIQPPMN